MSIHRTIGLHGKAERMTASVLDGIRVVEFSQLIAAPYCGLTLADLGADVIKVESVHGDHTRKWTLEGQESGFFHMFNRCKRGVALDFRTPTGRATARRLVASADVVIENLGDPSRVLGFDYAEAAVDNPGLVWCSITGFGRGRSERAIDQTLQASMGMIALTGEPDGPPLRVPLPVVDLVTGMYATQSILAALLGRERSGQGALLDCAMLDAAATLTSAAGVLWMTGYIPPPAPTATPEQIAQVLRDGAGHGRPTPVRGHRRAGSREVGLA
jgi:crotonobetainyl-CoA:carnitine CoA-transferase CaiB-like acyl-CoA transferase